MKSNNVSNSNMKINQHQCKNNSRYKQKNKKINQIFQFKQKLYQQMKIHLRKPRELNIKIKISKFLILHSQKTKKYKLIKKNTSKIKMFKLQIKNFKLIQKLKQIYFKKHAIVSLHKLLKITNNKQKNTIYLYKKMKNFNKIYLKKNNKSNNYRRKTSRIFLILKK